MKIVDLTPEHEHIYFCCLEEYSEDMKEAGDQKQKWYNYMKDKGLRVKLAQDDNGIIGGMIQYVPIEYSTFSGNNLYVVLCIWVHGHKQGRGDYRKHGMGKALLKAVEEDVKLLGADGLVVWGLIIPVFMRASWFKKQGYHTINKAGIIRMLWKPFNENAEPPKFMKILKNPAKGVDKVNVTLFQNGWCQTMNITCERIKRACMEFPDKINLEEFNTVEDREIVEEWGITDSIYIDGKELWAGPPLPYEKIRKKIERRVRKISAKKS